MTDEQKANTEAFIATESAKLDAERAEWDTRVEELLPKLRYMDMLTEAQIDMLSYRHRATDRIAEYRNVIGKVEDKIHTAKGILFEKIDAKYKERPLSYNDKVVIIQANPFISLNHRYKSLLDAQVEYLSQLVRTMDNVGFAIRNKIEMHNAHTR